MSLQDYELASADPWSNRPLTKGISEMVWVVCHPHLSIGSGIRVQAVGFNPL